MMKRRPVRILMFAAFGLAAATVVTLLFTGLWNWVMPVVFGLHTITVWQSLALLVLSRVLFGRFGGRGRGGHRMLWRRRMMERWEQMSPDERQKFRQGMCSAGMREA